MPNLNPEDYLDTWLIIKDRWYIKVTGIINYQVCIRQFIPPPLFPPTLKYKDVSYDLRGTYINSGTAGPKGFRFSLKKLSHIDEWITDTDFLDATLISDEAEILLLDLRFMEYLLNVQ